MGIRSLLGVSAASLMLAGCGGKDEAAAPKAPASPPSEPVLAVGWLSPGHGELYRANPLTLEPRGRVVELASNQASAWERSPDGTVLASGAGEPSAVQLVRLDDLRLLRTVELRDDGFVSFLSWPEPSRLFAVIEGAPPLVAVLDPRAGRVLTTHELAGVSMAIERTRDGLAVLLGPGDRIGPARLAVVTAEAVRYAELDGIVAGWGNEQEGHLVGPRQVAPGLAVDPSGRRAIVVPAGRTVAEVDLATLSVRSHTLAEPASLLHRFLDWLEPPAHAKSIDGPQREALWLPNGLVAVSGAGYETDEERVTMTPAGLSLIDTSDWSVRRIDDEASRVALAGDALLAFVWRMDSQTSGLIVYDREGRERYRLFREDADLSQVADGFLYAASDDGTRYEVIDLRSGKSIGRARPQGPTWLVPAS